MKIAPISNAYNISRIQNKKEAKSAHTAERSFELPNYKMFRGINFCGKNLSSVKEKTFLEPNEKTILPDDCQIRIGKNSIIDLRDKNLLEKLDEDGILIGSSNRSDLQIKAPGILDIHMRLRKTDEGISGINLGYKKGVQIIPKNEIKPIYFDSDGVYIKQKEIGDCFLLSTVYALSKSPKGQEILQDRVKIDDDGNYTVRFKDKEIEAPLSEVVDSSRSKSDSQQGIQAIEYAYAKYTDFFLNKMLGKDPMKGSINGGRDLKRFFYQLTGIKPSSHEIILFQNKKVEKVLNSLNEEKAKNTVIVCGVRYGGQKLKNRHAYAVTNVDPKTQTLALIDPHDTSKEIPLSFDDFFKYAGKVIVAQL